MSYVRAMRGNTQPYHAQHYPLPLGFNGRAAWLWRWFSGRPLNGHRYTDATGFHYGTMALDVSGRATPFQLLPGYKRFLYARFPAMAVPVLAAAWMLGHWLVVSFVLAGVVMIVAPSIQVAIRTRRFRRQVIEPVATAVAEVLNKRNVAGAGHTWVHVPENYRDDDQAKIKIDLPMSWIGQDGDKTRLTEVVAARLQVEDLSPSWTLHSEHPYVMFNVPPKPPAKVTFGHAKPDMDSAADSEFVVGYGPRNKVELFSLLLESPHLLIAGGSGAGKSELIAFLVTQAMRKGFGAAVLDAKFTSHMWLRRIPGVLYAAEAEELHNALIWLDAELLRRARFVADGGDPDTLVPLLVVLEEMNGASNRLRAYWNSIKVTGDPQMSPALTALVNLSSMGREMRVHIIMAGQSLTAKAVGGPENRENFGGRMFARATAAQWRMLAPQIKPAPLKRGAPGRWHIVVGDTLREFQVPFVDIKKDSGAHVIEHAIGGRPVPDVVAMMAGGATTERREVLSSEVVTPDGISLRQFADEQGLNLATVRKWSDRRDFPVEISIGANRTRLYDRDHLKTYVAARLREPATADE
jgi:hypothetical protein